MDEALKRARSNPGSVALLYEDEASFYRQPSQASLFCPRGREQPRLSYACKSNTVVRAAGFLDACTGALRCWDASRITAAKLAKCLREVSAIYAGFETVYVALDNWPVHFHPKVEAVLKADPRIRLLRLPTYSPWLNPIEKVWRLARQNVAHAHRMADDFELFKRTVRECLARPTDSPESLLRYVGLLTQ